MSSLFKRDTDDQACFNSCTSNKQTGRQTRQTKHCIVNQLQKLSHNFPITEPWSLPAGYLVDDVDLLENSPRHEIHRRGQMDEEASGLRLRDIREIGRHEVQSSGIGSLTRPLPCYATGSTEHRASGLPPPGASMRLPRVIRPTLDQANRPLDVNTSSSIFVSQPNELTRPDSCSHDYGTLGGYCIPLPACVTGTGASTCRMLVRSGSAIRVEILKDQKVNTIVKQ